MNFGMSLAESKSINLFKLVAYKFLSYQISFQKGDSNLNPHHKCETNLPLVQY